MTTSTLVSAFVAAALTVAGVAQATSIGVQFSKNGTPLTATDVAGVAEVAQDHWNALSNTAVPNAGLMNNSGAITTASLSAGGDADYFAGGAGFATAGDRALASHALLALYGNHVTYTVTAVPYASYDVYIYGQSDAPDRAITFTVTSAAPTATRSFLSENSATTWTEGLSTWNGIGTQPADVTHANYVHFSGLSGSTLTLDYFAPGNSGVNGFQIVEAVPEPASLGLLSVAATGLLSRRRRQA
jgi:hypothetical protein